MRKFLVVIFTIIVSLSCDCIKRDYERLMASRITFPETLQKVDRQDMLAFTVKNDNVHMIIYFDSTECSTCAISKLEDWEPLIEEAKSIYNYIDFIFIFSPTKSEMDKVMQNIVTNSQVYNIVLDDCGAFSQSNPQIPQDNRFHTMLLDKNNNVVLIGNPLYSNSIWELMKEALMNIKSNDGLFIAD